MAGADLRQPAARGSVGPGFVGVARVSQDPAHFLDGGHPIERRFQILDSGTHGLHHLVSRAVGQHASLFPESSVDLGAFS
jgi:hypothetical protein